MTPNEKLSIEDLFFNGENGLVGKNTNFYKNFVPYIKAKREEDMELAKLHLEVCLWEAQYGSNKRKDPGAQNRRNSEITVLNTYDIYITQGRDPEFLASDIKALHKRREAEGINRNQSYMLEEGREKKIDRFINGIKFHIKEKTMQEILTEDDVAGLKNILRYHFYVDKATDAIAEMREFISKKLENREFGDEQTKSNIIATANAGIVATWVFGNIW